MSGLELNKIAAAVLLGTLITVIVGVVADSLYKPVLKIAERGHIIPGVDEEEEIDVTANDKAKPKINIAELMTKANAQQGEKVIKKCISCHSFNKNGDNKIGPNLYNIVNFPKASKEGFSYSKALLEAGGVWDYESLFYFLQKPRQYMPGTKMSFIGLQKPQDIADVISYLMQLK